MRLSVLLLLTLLIIPIVGAADRDQEFDLHLDAELVGESVLLKTTYTLMDENLTFHLTLNSSANHSKKPVLDFVASTNQSTVSDEFLYKTPGHNLTLQGYGSKLEWSMRLMNTINCSSSSGLPGIHRFPFTKCNGDIDIGDLPGDRYVTAEITISDSRVLIRDRTNLTCYSERIRDIDTYKVGEFTIDERPINETLSTNLSQINFTEQQVCKVEETDTTGLWAADDYTSQSKRIAVLEPIFVSEVNTRFCSNTPEVENSLQKSGECKLSFAYKPSPYYRFVFYTALFLMVLVAAIGSYYNGRTLASIGIIVAIWTFQEALIPLNGLNRPLYPAIYDLTILVVLVPAIWRYKSQITGNSPPMIAS